MRTKPTPTEELLALGMFGRGSRLAERVELLLKRGRDFSPRVSKALMTLGAVGLIGCIMVGTLAPRWIAFAQARAFEVASIKLAAIQGDAYFNGRTADGTCGKTRIAISGDRVTLPFISLCGLIRMAYDVQPYRISGVPNAMAKADPSNFYDIEAKAAGEDTITMDRALDMLRTLLADRFQLKVHHETKEMPVYALVVGKNGSKLQVTGEGVCDLSPAALAKMGTGRGIASCKPNTSASQLADMLTPETDRPVINKTGLTGQYAFRMQWVPDGTSTEPNSGPGLFTAIQEQLGLKLEPQKAQVDVLVIDRAERPDAN